jgi:hypothetical protein
MIFVSYDFCLYHRGNFCPLFWRGSGISIDAEKMKKSSMSGGYQHGLILEFRWMAACP